MTTVAVRDSGVPTSGVLAALRRRGKLWLLALTVLAWVAVWAATRGTSTQEIGGATLTDAHQWFRGRAAWVEDAASAGTNPVFGLANGIADLLNGLIAFLQRLFTVPEFPRPYPEIGWLGVIAMAAWVTYAVAGWRSVLLVVPSFLAFGFLGYWEDSLDLLIITLVSVFIAVVIGIPLGVAMAHSKIVSAILTPVLDVMQTMPSFIYLLPLTIVFGIGSAAATIVTLIYALPPVVRITAHGIRSVSPSTLEATRSLGQSGWQRLRNVELPMSKRTVIVGINQTMMAALSMATIAAFIDSPGLGQPVLEGLRRGQLGASAVAGLAIVIMAIMLDRTTTAASIRAERAARAGRDDRRRRRLVLTGTGVLTLAAIGVSHNQVWANPFPSSPDLGSPIAAGVDRFADWLRTDLSGLTTAIQEAFTVWFLNPVQDLVANSPWFVTAAALLAVAAIAGGRRALASTAVCLAGIYFLDLWYNAMVTLTSVFTATAVTMVVGVALGVWMGRSGLADRAIRPVLDAAQTIPPFVYLVPILILFGPNRFTAIVAGVIYAVPPATKLIADGIRGVAPATVEAAESAGTSRLQMITKVQIPMARGALLVAGNQGLLYVLSMVVIGGMVGAGALGFDIVTGFRQTSMIGRGLAAGVAIVLLGIMLDRITTHAANQSASTNPTTATHRRRRPLTGGIA
ncbi:MAG: ABC transporter permease subunit [Nocardioidaceae bacterium]|nr:ABC transporter permease subunit [Nocardioidaceae bacterium]